MRLQALDNYSSFQIHLGMSHFHSQPLSSSFRSFHWTSVCFHGPQYGRIPLEYKPLPAFRSANFEASFFSRKTFKLLETENFAEVQSVIDSC